MANISFAELLRTTPQAVTTATTFYENMTEAEILAEAMLRDFTNAGGSYIVNANGDVLGYYVGENIGAMSNIGSVADSTTIGASTAASVNIPAQTGLTSGKVTFASGMKTAGTFVSKTVLPAIAAVSAGIGLGKTIDRLLYNIRPEFWDSHNLSTLNPDTWGVITAGDNSVSARLVNMVFGLNNTTGEMQAYVPDDFMAYIAAYMAQYNALSETEKKRVQEGFPDLWTDTFICGHNLFMQWTGTGEYTDYYNGYSNDAFYAIFKNEASSRTVYTISASETQEVVYNNNTGSRTPPEIGSKSFTHNGQTVYYNVNSSSSTGLIDAIGAFNYNFPSVTLVELDNYAKQIAWIMVYGDPIGGTTIEGIGNQEGARIPIIDGLTDLDAIKTALENQLPDIFDNKVTNSIVQPDGTIKEINYVPVPLPQVQISPEGKVQPTTGTSTQTDPKINTETTPQTEQQTAADTASDPASPKPSGTGASPELTPPVGSASALFTVYNPTQAQLNSFGSWMWSSNFVDQLKKLFNDPMQAIIGLHKVFASPTVSGQGTIKCGYIDSEVPSNIVSSQYTTVSCGSVDMQEYFGNVFDYADTELSLFLPFVGFVPLSVADVMRSTITVKYHVDVLTGACLAEVLVKRDAQESVLYTYSGNAAVSYPISSGSYMGIVSGVVSVAGSAVATIASGGALAPLLFGAAGQVGRMHTNIQHSGNLSGNSGAMGGKTPFIIITRPITATPNEFPGLQGVPSNNYVSLSELSGFVRVKEVHVENIPAYDAELSEIESLLKSGVIL